MTGVPESQQGEAAISATSLRAEAQLRNENGYAHFATVREQMRKLADHMEAMAVYLPESQQGEAARCPKCLGLNGVHDFVHVRHPAGGGGANLPCPLGAPAPQPAVPDGAAGEARLELGLLIGSVSRTQHVYAAGGHDACQDAADAVIAAGWVPPERLAEARAEGAPTLAEWGTRDDWYDVADIESYGTTDERPDGEDYARLDAKRMGLSLWTRQVTPWVQVPLSGGES